MTRSVLVERRWSLALGLMLTLLSSSLSLTVVRADDDFTVRQPLIRLENDVYVLDSAIETHFSAVALEALDHGVPLTIVVQVQVRRSKAWLWEESLLDKQLRSVIRYKPLSDGYEVYSLPEHQGRRFATREAALRALGEITHLQLVHQDKLHADAAYEVQIRVFLDIEELPLPLRPLAYLKPAWKLSSGWSRWPLQP